MKKIIAIIILLIFSSITLFYYKPITSNYLFGIARVLEQDDDYQLDINNKIYKNCVFKSTESFDKKRKHNFLILYLRDIEIESEFKIIVVNLDEKVTGYCCGSFKCYDKVFGKLFQSDMGSFYTRFEDDTKGPGFDTKLKIENEKIDFYIPSQGNKKLNIELSKKTN
nr:hypothetical protein [uncultured Flavobacterium sp.]